MKRFIEYKKKSYFNGRYNQIISVYTDYGENIPSSDTDVSYNHRTIFKYQFRFSWTGKTVKSATRLRITIDRINATKTDHRLHYDTELKYVGKAARDLYKQLNEHRQSPFSVTHVRSGYADAEASSSDCQNANFVRSCDTINLLLTL